MIEEWQKTKDSAIFGQLMTRYNPVVHKFSNQFGTAGVNKNAIKSKARAQVIRAISSYNPNAGTQPITHVYNNLKKLNRVATNSLTSGHIPESRALKMSTYKSTVDNLEDRLGREANNIEIADELKWSVKEVGRMNNELTGETTASNAEFDFFGNSTSGKSRDAELIDYMYMELDGKDKVVFEHTFGYGGKKKLNNKDIAGKLKTNEMAVGRIKKRLSQKIRDYR